MIKAKAKDVIQPLFQQYQVYVYMYIEWSIDFEAYALDGLLF